MRKIILPLIILLFATATQAQYVTIPDTLFRNFLMLKYPACFNASKQMDTTCSSILNEKSLSINNNVKDISGIVYFKGLQHLSCAYNTNITGLPKLPDSLTHLNMQSCYALATINSFPKLFSYINVSGVALLSLPTLPNSLDTLFCAGHKFTSLPALPNTLRYL